MVRFDVGLDGSAGCEVEDRTVVSCAVEFDREGIAFCSVFMLKKIAYILRLTSRLQD